MINITNKKNPPALKGIEEIKKLIKKHDRIAVISHISPDIDAIGSMLGLSWWINDVYPKKTVQPMINGKPNARYEFMNNFEQILWTNNVAKEFKKYELIIIVDTTELSRVSNSPEDINPTKHLIVSIDHHEVAAQSDYEVCVIAPDRASNCEIIVEEFYTEKQLSNRFAAEIVLSGILTDTGFFKFVGYKNSQVFDTAKKIVNIAKIKQIDEVSSKMKGTTVDEFEAMQMFVANTNFIDFNQHDSATYSYLSKAEYEQIGSSTIVTNAKGAFMGAFLRRITDHPWGFILTPREAGGFKMSFRASNNIAVNKLSEDLFNGGGHENASGGYFVPETEMDTEQACVEVIKLIDKYRFPSDSE